MRLIGLLACSALVGAFTALPASAQQAPFQFPNMSFFISGSPGPDGANFGGIEGADKHCQDLAATVGAGGKTWRAYVSQQAMDGKPAINARDRIGKGPWVNALGLQIASSVEALHDANRNSISVETGVSEQGKRIPTRAMVVNFHDILTGTLIDGTAPPPGKDMTCGNWTKNNEGSAMVGHFDRAGTPSDGASWNAAHPSAGCSRPSLARTGGNGLLYCFAAN
ncbi:MAG: lectin [Beijerinckiaceae bacterium]|nr:lectin [Beijerinckiaceae bacterium]